MNTRCMSGEGKGEQGKGEQGRGTGVQGTEECTKMAASLSVMWAKNRRRKREIESGSRAEVAAQNQLLKADASGRIITEED